MFSDIAMDILERVEECRCEARQTINPEEKAAWLALAEDWLRLAHNTPRDHTPEALREEVKKLAPA